MNKLFTIAAIVLSLTGLSASQGKVIAELKMKQAELISPWDFQGAKGVYNAGRRHNSCLDLINFEQLCGRSETLSYGNRVGKNWDIFAISGGRDSRTRMIDLGKHKWDDAFNIPDVEPWPALKPGEMRAVYVNTSGADGKDGGNGRDGLPGRNADGSYPDSKPSQRTAPKKQKAKSEDFANATLTRQVTSKITFNGKVVADSAYTPMTEVKLGHMYLVRVVENESDHYVLMRVDEVVRGARVKISYFSFPFAL